MGGLLSTKSRSEREWEAILNHHAWSATGLPEELDKRIYLSYEDLSPQLKQCFLYCSLFPKGTTIQMAQVIPMWISEGFIQPLNGSSSQEDQLEEIAAECYHKLIMRNLIEPAHHITRFNCTMHDVVRSFAEFMAKEDSLVVLDKQVAAVSKDNSHIRRMSVAGPSTEWTILHKQKSLRTLIMNCKINSELTDLSTSFSRLRVLSITGGDCDRLLDSLCQLRHLRYFFLEETSISSLPKDIHRMKFLQNILIRYSRNLENLPRTIIKLVHLRTLDMYGSNINVMIPKGFGGLTNLRRLHGFPVHKDMDGNWCSLEEIGPLSQLRILTLHGLENVAASSLAEMAMIRTKEHLDYLVLDWSTSGCIELGDEIEKQQQQHIAEEVLEKLCPPPRIGSLWIRGYFGRMLPNWMMAPASGAFKGLRHLKLVDLSCCTKLPDGLCRLPSLELLEIMAPAIKNIGFEFQAPCSSLVVGGGVTPSPTSAAFPSLTHLQLEGLCECEEWDWKEQTEDLTAHDMTMPALNVLTIDNCKLRCLPPGLANSKRHALRELNLYELTNLTFVENFPSVVELDVFDCPELKRISGLSRLHKVRILCCPNVEVLEGVPSLDSLELSDDTMETLPGYLQVINPRYLELNCSKQLCESLLPGSSEWNKISHIRKLNIVDMEDWRQTQSDDEDQLFLY
ncbi:putative disease resistance RPP13-like protein 1 [Dichanthelium oligosanthes]|uniref:Putative disease resistance RPP13-like protein 1 n=1 Tax=Dichanthelium oligosanthes TaxID=888268 RepID=A0A1E5WM10_9POAL|nr:putative disease resistance RPP13-like protein 1 [Dichanthelium oligosanthes]